MDKKKKIMAIIIALIIVVGIIVVATKGFNVSLYLKSHTILSYTFDQAIEKSDVKEICKEVFGSKNFDVRMVEVFDDSVYIISETITEEEQEQLLEKLSSLNSNESETEEVEESTETEETIENSEEIESTEIEETTEEAVESETDESTEEVEETSSTEDDANYYIYYDSNVELFDLVKPYILPLAVAAIIVILCMIVRYKILKSEKVIKKTLLFIAESIVLLLVLLSIIAIFRIPVNTWMLPFLILLMLIYIVIRFEIEIRKKSNEK